MRTCSLPRRASPFGSRSSRRSNGPTCWTILGTRRTGREPSARPLSRAEIEETLRSARPSSGPRSSRLPASHRRPRQPPRRGARRRGAQGPANVRQVRRHPGRARAADVRPRRHPLRPAGARRRRAHCRSPCRTRVRTRRDRHLPSIPPRRHRPSGAACSITRAGSDDRHHCARPPAARRPGGSRTRCSLPCDSWWATTGSPTPSPPGWSTSTRAPGSMQAKDVVAGQDGSRRSDPVGDGRRQGVATHSRGRASPDPPAHRRRRASRR